MIKVRGDMVLVVQQTPTTGRVAADCIGLSAGQHISHREGAGCVVEIAGREFLLLPRDGVR